jgi:4-amino-4-deoxy-L-arabinose transferase-like glycosyltransferase
LLITTVGYVGASIVLGPGQRHWAEVAGLSFAGGAGICGAIFFVLSLAGIVPNRAILAALAALAAFGIVILWKRNRWLRCSLPEPLPRRWDAWEIIGALAALLILLAVINTAISILTPGIADIDAYAIWMFKAKMVASEPLLPVPAALKLPALSFSHQDYPFGFPLLVAGAYAVAGAVDEQAGKLVLVPVYLAFIAVVYGALRRVLPRADAIVITALLVAAPIVRQQSASAVAEMLLVVLHTCCLVLLWRWMEIGERRNLLAAGAFAAFAAFAKNEGLALLPIVGFIALLNVSVRRSRKLSIDWIAATAIAVTIILPWLLYRRLLPRTQEDYGAKLLSLAAVMNDLPRLTRVLPKFVGLLVQLKEAGPIWLVLVIIALIGWRAYGRLPVLLLWLLLITHLLLYVATFMISPWKPEVLIPMIGPKLLLHAAPLAAMLIAAHLATLRGHPKPIARR